MRNILKELKQVYKEKAQQISGLKNKDQIELANLYHSDDKNREIYLSELVIRYWNIAAKAAYQNVNIFSEEDAYEWYIEAVLSVLDERVWTRESSSLYNDPKAFEKALNVRFFCIKTNWFQASNRHKRKLLHDTVSLDKCMEDYEDFTFHNNLIDYTDISDIEIHKELIKTCFSKKQYLFAIIIDLIAKQINIDKISDHSSLAISLKKHLSKFEKSYIAAFALEYDLQRKEVEEAYQKTYNISEKRIRSSINYYILKLKSLLLQEGIKC